MDFINEYPNTLSKETCEVFLNNIKPYTYQEDDDNYVELFDLYEPVSKDEVYNEAVIKMVTAVNEKIKDYFEPMQELMPYSFSYCGFSIMKTKPEGLQMHHDEPFMEKGDLTPRAFIAIIYLTDLMDGEGGEIFFPFQNKAIRPAQGTLVIFPTFFTHPHVVLPTVADRFALRLKYKVNTDTIRKNKGMVI